MQKYKYQEFPRVVYGPDGATTIINSEEERPDGYVNHPDDIGAKPVAKKATRASKKADAAAKEAAEDERQLLVAFLDEHDVDFDTSADIATLRSLADELKAHIAAQEQAQTDGNSA